MLSEEEVLKRIENLTQKLKNYKAAADTSTQAAQSLKNEIEQLKLKLDESENNYLRLKEMTYKTIRHLVEDVIEARDSQIEDIEKDLNVATEAIKEKKTQIDTLTEENKALKEDNENMALVLNKTNDKVNALDNEKKKIAENPKERFMGQAKRYC